MEWFGLVVFVWLWVWSVLLYTQLAEGRRSGVVDGRWVVRVGGETFYSNPVSAWMEPPPRWTARPNAEWFVRPWEHRSDLPPLKIDWTRYEEAQ